MGGWQEEGQVLSWHKEALSRIKTLRTGTLCTDTHAHIHTPSMPILIYWNSEHKHSPRSLKQIRTWCSLNTYFLHPAPTSYKQQTYYQLSACPIWVATGVLRRGHVHFCTISASLRTLHSPSKSSELVHTQVWQEIRDDTDWFHLCYTLKLSMNNLRRKYHNPAPYVLLCTHITYCLTNKLDKGTSLIQLHDRF